MIDENKFSNIFLFSWQALLQYKVRSRKVTSGSTPAKKSQKEMLQSSSPSKKASMTTGIQVFYLIVSILINKTFILSLGFIVYKLPSAIPNYATKNSRCCCFNIVFLIKLSNFIWFFFLPRLWSSSWEVSALKKNWVQTNLGSRPSMLIWFVPNFNWVIFYSSPNLLVHHQISMMHHQILKFKK